MRRVLLLGLIAFASGCSNAPVAGLLDCVSPIRGNRNEDGRGPVVPEIRPENRPPRPSSDGLPPPSDLPPISPRP